MEGQEDKQMMDAQTDRWREKTAEWTALRLNSFRDLWSGTWWTGLGFKEMRENLSEEKGKINGWMDRWMGSRLE